MTPEDAIKERMIRDAANRGSLQTNFTYTTKKVSTGKKFIARSIPAVGALMIVGLLIWLNLQFPPHSEKGYWVNSEIAVIDGFLGIIFLVVAAVTIGYWVKDHWNG